MTDSRGSTHERERVRKRRHSSRREISRSTVELGRVVLLALITLAPWLSIPLRPAGEFWALAVTFLCLLLWAASWRGQPTRYTTPGAVLPLLAALLLAGGQLIAWPESLYAVVTPGGANLESRLRDVDVAALDSEGSAPHAEDPAPDGNWPSTISLYPAATRQNLAMLILATAVFLLASRYLTHERNLLLMCIVLGGNGAALAFFGMVQHLTWNGKLFWTIPITVNAQPFSAFINRNNAGGFLCLGLAGAVGLLYWSMERGGRPPGRLPDSRDSALVALLMRWWDYLRWRVSRIDGYQTGALALTGLTSAGILYSMSRGAILAMLLAGAVTMLTAMFLEKRFSSAAILGVAALVVMGLLVWVGGVSRVSARLATLSESRTVDGRLLIWKDALATANDFKLSGAGLGAFRYVYNLYQQRPDPAWYLHAENQYIEALVDAGVPGLLLILLALAWAVWNLASLFQRTRDPAQRGLLLMGVFALVSQAAMASVDFGLYLPGNFLVLAAICGMLAGRAQAHARGRHEGSRPSVPRSVVIAVAASELTAPAALGEEAELEIDPEPSSGESEPSSTGEPASNGSARKASPKIKWYRGSYLAIPLALAATAWAMYDSWQSWGVNAAIYRIQSRLLDPGLEEEGEFDEELPSRVLDDVARLEQALAARPDDLEGHLQAAMLYLKEYQRRAVRWFRPVVGPDIPEAKLREELFLHAWVHHLRRIGDVKVVRALTHPELAGEIADPRLAAWAKDDIARTTLAPALAHLRQADAACPLDARVSLGLAKLVWLDGDWDEEEFWLSRTRRMAPGDGNLFAETGLIELNLDHKAEVWKDWQKALTLGTSYEADIVNHARQTLVPSEMISSLFPQSPAYLVRIAESYFREQPDLQRQIAAHAETVLSDADLPRSKPAYHHLRARIYLLNQQAPLAMKSYERALKLEPENVIWRFELAGLYFQAGMLPEARNEVRRAAANGKGTPEMLQLLNDINAAILKAEEGPAPDGAKPEGKPERKDDPRPAQNGSPGEAESSDRPN